ncbi:uncharacterized protein HKW66_Vig0122450 [Vigna angularis]|uniref:Uncharacterized protein n=1 Tax=Phaseolus angularis TaxID=3914 RepID=A0A8T0K0S8_PHAAN|nr:uncharacterized protein HKW66_Vig0122450 [Vigna angularis]
MSLSFCILLIITFTLFMQSIPITADLKMRKLGLQQSPPPSPRSGSPLLPADVPPPNSGA